MGWPVDETHRSPRQAGSCQQGQQGEVGVRLGRRMRAAVRLGPCLARGKNRLAGEQCAGPHRSLEHRIQGDPTGQHSTSDARARASRRACQHRPCSRRRSSSCCCCCHSGCCCLGNGRRGWGRRWQAYSWLLGCMRPALTDRLKGCV